MFPVSKKQTGCLICKSGLGKSPGPLCESCMAISQKRHDQKKSRARRSEPAEDDEAYQEGEQRGLSGLEEVIRQDNARIEQQAKRREQLRHPGGKPAQEEPGEKA